MHWDGKFFFPSSTTLEKIGVAQLQKKKLCGIMHMNYLGWRAGVCPLEKMLQ